MARLSNRVVVSMLHFASTHDIRPPGKSEYLTVPEIAKIRRRSRRTVYGWIVSAGIGDVDGPMAVARPMSEFDRSKNRCDRLEQSYVECLPALSQRHACRQNASPASLVLCRRQGCVIKLSGDKFCAKHLE
jgi:hypothetical protein